MGDGMAKVPKKKKEESTNPWLNMPTIDENDPYWKKVRESTKDALRCPHCDQLYFMCDALNEDTGKIFCPECENEIKSGS